MARKYSAFGTLLKIGDGNATAEVFTTVPGVQDITGPEFVTEKIDVTAHDSANGFREYVAGLKDTGEIGFTLVYDPATPTHDDATGLFKHWNDRLLHNYKLVFTDTLTPGGPTTMSFTGLVTSFSFAAPVNGAATVDVAISPSGAPVFTP